MGAIKIAVLVIAVLALLAVFAIPNAFDRAKSAADSVISWVGMNTGGIAPSVQSGTKHAMLSIEPTPPFIIKPDLPVDLTSGGVHVSRFSGDIEIQGSTVLLSEATGMNMSLPANGTVVSNLKISSLSYNGIPFYIYPNITATSGNISISGFHGSGSVEGGRLVLEGNVSGIKANIGGINIEM